MFDTRAAERRFRRTLFKTSILAQELQHRLSLFKRVQDAFAVNGTAEDSLSDDLIIDLTYLYLIMTENDEKNGIQLRELARSCHVSLITLTYTVDSGNVTSETSECRSTILDIMEPWAIEAFDEPHTTQSHYRDTLLGSVCHLKPVSLVYLARQCTSARYFALNPRDCLIQSQIKTYSSPSMRFDDDWTNHVQISSTPHRVPGLDSVRLSQRVTGTWNGSWEGALIIPSTIDSLQPCQIFTCACPLQMNIREYISFDESQFVSYVTKGDDTSTDYSDETLVEMTWLPKDVKFEEFRTSLNIGWDMEQMSIVDTILIGEADSTHHGDFAFRGRINPYCSRLALTDPQSQGLGIWVLYGEARRGGSFWGNWRASRTKPVPAAHGWFYITKTNDLQLGGA
ncbi:hypothetical protein Clacol_000007 [Clathrus columnatus]|uniref:Uncharacterized protein n=1 Tax=Clathrus columnatus TaxID=1419009 RepID=A0AAV4ZWH6_9AGAM|nr:hypothetical protein Clacol_000007 [Clathrus columnatus]